MAVSVQFSTIVGMFDEVTKKFADVSRPLLQHKSEKNYRGIAHSEYRRNVELFSRGLVSLRVRKKGAIAIISENRPEWVIANMGIALTGAVDAPIYPTLTAKQIEHNFNATGVSIAVVSNQPKLNKVLKIRKRVKTLRKVIMMSEHEDASPKGFVMGRADFTAWERRTKSGTRIIWIRESRKSLPTTFSLIDASGTTGIRKKLCSRAGTLC